MIRGITFTARRVKAEDDGAFHEYNMGDGIIWGCNITASGPNIFISSGAMISCGRLIAFDGEETIPVEAPADGFIRLRLRIDLAGTATKTDFGQLTVHTDYSTTISFPALTQEPINITGTVYDIELGVFQSTGGMLVNTVRTIGQAQSLAEKLKVARTMRTNLASANPASFDGTADITPGVSGVLGIGNGGLGNSRGSAPMWNDAVYTHTSSFLQKYFMMISEDKQARPVNVTDTHLNLRTLWSGNLPNGTTINVSGIRNCALFLVEANGYHCIGHLNPINSTDIIFSSIYKDGDHSRSASGRLIVTGTGTTTLSDCQLLVHTVSGYHSAFSALSVTGIYEIQIG